MRFFYFCYPAFKQKEQDKLENKTHNIIANSSETLFSPKEISEKFISPETMYELIKKFNIKKIVLLDRIKGNKKHIEIKDHINKSGINLLIGKTPFGEGPVFPDMSRIYSYENDKILQTVSTIGPERFKKTKSIKRETYSEAIGIIAPLWHYFGVKIKGVGIHYTKMKKEVNYYKDF